MMFFAVRCLNRIDSRIRHIGFDFLADQPLREIFGRSRIEFVILSGFSVALNSASSQNHAVIQIKTCGSYIIQRDFLAVQFLGIPEQFGRTK